MSESTTLLIAALRRAYEMELETLANYLANSVHLDGLLAEEVKSALAKDIPSELGHATALANRIKTIGGTVPGSLEINFDQHSLQPPQDTTDLLSVIKGVIEAEEGAIAQYKKIIALAEGSDYVTQDLAIRHLADEEEHRREFTGYLREYDRHSARFSLTAEPKKADRKPGKKKK
ncbi:MAG: ferritin-like domain-containing protein [Candidatus Sumerlaeia bacterium]|nr:ferritin-like domain-containing protein [Candidatus Sumerlaeia bacterium]